MKKLFLIFVASVAFAQDVDNLSVAREALRDGLWDVARNHARQSSSDEAQLIVLESYALENRWLDILRELSAMDISDQQENNQDKIRTENLPFRYYKALALSETDRIEEAEKILDSTTFSIQPYDRLSAMLSARLALAKDDKAKALRILKTSKFYNGESADKLFAAEIFAKNDNLEEAEKLWRNIATTNSNEEIFVTAAVNLFDVKLLREAFSSAKTAKWRKCAGLNLGRALLRDEKTFSEGENIIQTIAMDDPDTPGACEAFINLADAQLSSSNFVQSASSFQRALEVWPQLLHDASVQESRAWALCASGNIDAAITSFSRAEELATNDVTRARLILAQGDAMSSLGRGEEAMEKYRLVLEKYPLTPAGEALKEIVKLRELESKARALYENYEFLEAQNIFQQIAKEDSKRASRMEYCVMLCLYGQGKDREAYAKAKSLKDTTSDASVLAEVTLWLAKFSFNRNRWKDSISHFETFVKLSPDSNDAPSALMWAARAAFNANEFEKAIALSVQLSEQYPNAMERINGFITQGKALIELARFDEAVLIMERLSSLDAVSFDDQIRANILRADALFAMGADNVARYREALEAYRSVRQGVDLKTSTGLSLSFKIGRTLEKLKRIDEAIDAYYVDVVLAYREGRRLGLNFDDASRAVFTRAAFRLADEYEIRGKEFQALHILELVVSSDVSSTTAAEERIKRIQSKGRFL